MSQLNLVEKEDFVRKEKKEENFNLADFYLQKHLCKICGSYTKIDGLYYCTGDASTCMFRPYKYKKLS